MQGQRIGYTHTVTSSDSLNGKPVQKSVSKTVMDADMLGTALKITIDSTTWTINEKAVRMLFTIESSGRKQVVEASFGADAVSIKTKNGNAVSTKSLPLPKDGQIVDDPVTAFMTGDVPAGSERTFYVLDPMTTSLVKNVARLKGPTKTSVRGQDVDATLVEVVEPRATTRIYLSAKGEFIKATGALGIEMLPISEAEALGEKPTGTIDIADATRVKPDKPLGRIEDLRSATLRVTGRDLSRLPSDGHQTVSKDGDSWLIVLHPVPFSKNGASIAAAQVGRQGYLKPSLYVPADQPAFKHLAKKISGDAKNVGGVARKVHDWVYAQMRPNAGIGVLRDASEVLSSKEGVCRDYAILTATLLRARGIPTRLCSGLIYYEEAFYYHAWVEFWDGKAWIGLDSTRPDPELTPGHLKLAHGNVEDAFSFTVLENTKIEVVRTERKGKA